MLLVFAQVRIAGLSPVRAKILRPRRPLGNVAAGEYQSGLSPAGP
jgi:hypothetical protein